MPPESAKKCIGYWMSDKKIQRLNVNSLNQLCKKIGYDLVKLDLSKPLEQQGPFCIIFHKCTDIIVGANAGDRKCQEMIASLENYIAAHPEVPILDPLDKIRRMLNRYQSYRAIRDNARLADLDVFAPTSVELTSLDAAVNLSTLKAAGVQFPFVCKPSVAQGSDAHEMALIFNESGLVDCRPPAVAQTFINHNAVLYKIFCVSTEYVIVERPSLKNFYSLENQQTIFFSSADVSKPGSSSSLSILDDDDPMRDVFHGPLDSERLKLIVETIHQEFGLQLMGIDLLIENKTGRYVVIDINAFPSYDGFPDFWSSVLKCLQKSIRCHIPTSPEGTPDRLTTSSDHDNSGFITNNSSEGRLQNLPS